MLKRVAFTRRPTRLSSRHYSRFSHVTTANLTEEHTVNKGAEKCLQTLVIKVPFLQVYLVVDTMGEIPSTGGREETCTLLEELSQNSKMHILMTSRREHDIIEYMSECNSVTDRFKIWKSTMTSNYTSKKS
jgi:hypothetical protein